MYIKPQHKMTDYLKYLYPCPRALYFGVLTGVLVGGLSGGIDAFSSATKLKPRPDNREISRAAITAAMRTGGAGATFFGLYQVAKCALYNSRRKHGLDEWPIVGVAAVTAALPAAALFRPNWVLFGLLFALDNGSKLLPALKKDD